MSRAALVVTVKGATTVDVETAVKAIDESLTMAGYPASEPPRPRLRLVPPKENAP